jgi:hypothetical protein
VRARAVAALGPDVVAEPLSVGAGARP